VTCRRLAAQRGHSRVSHFIDSVLGGKVSHVTGEHEEEEEDKEEGMRSRARVGGDRVVGEGQHHLTSAGCCACGSPGSDLACLATAADGGKDGGGGCEETRCEGQGMDCYDFDAEDWSGSMESGMSESAALELLRSPETGAVPPGGEAVRGWGESLGSLGGAGRRDADGEVDRAGAGGLGPTVRVRGQGVCVGGEEVREAGTRAARVVAGNERGREDNKEQLRRESSGRAARRGAQADHGPDVKAEDAASEAASFPLPPPRHGVSTARAQREGDRGGFVEVLGEGKGRELEGADESDGGDDSTEAPYYQKLIARRRPQDGQVPILQLLGRVYERVVREFSGRTHCHHGSRRPSSILTFLYYLRVCRAARLRM